MSEESSTRLFVGNVAVDTSVNDIAEIFSQFGKIDDIQLMGKDFCFVEMSSLAEANSIIQYSGDLQIKGRKLRISYATKRKKDLSSNNVYRGNGGMSQGVDNSQGVTNIMRN